MQSVEEVLTFLRFYFAEPEIFGNFALVNSNERINQ